MRLTITPRDRSADPIHLFAPTLAAMCGSSTAITSARSAGRFATVARSPARLSGSLTRTISAGNAGVGTARPGDAPDRSPAAPCGRS